MKYLLIFILAAAAACGSENPRKSAVYCGYWIESIPYSEGVQSSFIQCDSVKVVDKSHSIGYVGGNAVDIYGIEVLIHYRKCN